jgi:L-ascorbate metabolism protein UlaG (beta-lactamase superfamily)
MIQKLLDDMKLKRLAQSTVLLTSKNGKTLLIDPGKYNLDPGKLTPQSFPLADIIFITHKHADHFDIDLLKAIVSRSQPRIFTNEEIKPVLEKHGIRSQLLKPGDDIQESGFAVKAIQTDHVVRGELIINFGLVVVADGKSVYHTSDTRFIDPSILPPETRADYLLVPISNRGVVMGIDDALVFANELKPKVVIPTHYDSPKDKDRVDPKEFEQKGQKFDLQVRVLSFGEEIEL